MITARLLTVLAASILAGTVYAQTQPAPSTQPSAAPGYNTSNPHKREMKSAPGNEAASPNARPAPGAALTTSQTQSTPGNGSAPAKEGRSPPGAALTTSSSSDRNHAQAVRLAETGPGGHSWSSMQVESPSGQSLGSVANVVPGLDGKETSGYVLVSGANGMSVPVPYATASSMVRGGKLILNSSHFQHAPKVSQEELQKSSDHAWRAKADHYWMHMRRSSK
ncbi:MAG TPA: hypothetical protein VIC29_06650 [Steroidobacteraceae bacterium]|jgi:hypothetical protein